MYKITFLGFLSEKKQTVDMNYEALEHFLNENPLIEICECKYDGLFYEEELTQKVQYLHSLIRNYEYKKKDIAQCEKIEQEISDSKTKALLNSIFGAWCNDYK